MTYSPYMLKRYIWLVDLLNRTNGLTREQINSRWAHSYLNEKQETEIPERTFCLRVSAQRWYITGKKVNGDIRTYGLDRIINLKISDKPFEMPTDFDAKEYFTHCVGVTVGTDELEKVELLIQDG